MYFTSGRRKLDVVRDPCFDAAPWNYPSLREGERDIIDADGVVADWKGVLHEFDVTRHSVVQGTSTPSAGVIRDMLNRTATQRLAFDHRNSMWSIGRYCEADLDAGEELWRIFGLTFVAKLGSSNHDLATLDHDRVAGAVS
jgi:hypothetical protein